MHKHRAASYLRRTISEPYRWRRPSGIGTGASGGIGRAGVPFLETGGAHLEARLNGERSPYYPIDAGDTPIFTWATDAEGMKMLLFTKLNWALLLFPLGILSSVYGWGDLSTFWLNFLALVPLAALLGNLTEELALHTGDLAGGLLNATFGNAVEMILTVQALRANLLSVVRGTLLGSILSNLLLVLGMSFFGGGLFHHVQKFNASGATCSTSMLLLASLAFITPTVTKDSSSTDLLMLSRLTALLMAMTYCLFLFFQLGTHLTLFKIAPEVDEDGDVIVDETEWPTMSASTATVLLGLVTATISVSSECLVGSIEGVSRNSGLPESFIGVILLPIVGNAAEHVTAVCVAIKDKPDLAMSVAVGSSTQIAMFMVPFAVLAGWAMGIPMSLAFSNVSATVLTFSILIVIGVVQDGESNWLEGVMLIVAYLIVAIVFWFDKPEGSSN